jgi:hypothetical protein
LIFRVTALVDHQTPLLNRSAKINRGLCAQIKTDKQRIWNWVYCITIIIRGLLFLKHFGKWNDSERTIINLLFVISYNNLYQFQYSRFNKALEVFVLFFVIFRAVVAVYVNLYKYRKPAKEVYLFTYLG